MNPDFISALREIEKERNIPMETLLLAIEDALTTAYKKHFGTDENASVKINRTTGDMEVLAEKTIVARVKDPQTEISVAQAKKINPDAEKGETVNIVMPLGTFGRIAAQTARQVIVQRLKEAERDIVFNELTKKEGQLVTATVQRYDQRNIVLEMGKAEGVLPASEQIPGEHFRHGERIKGLVLEARKTTRGSQVIVSRSHPDLIKILFSMEVPEIARGLVEIVSVARDPGYRSKIAVASKEGNIDPVGSCVGPRGSRVQSVVDELRGEKIDIVHYDKDNVVFICNALAPAKVVKVCLNQTRKSALVIVADTQLSLAIGKEGQNARLAAKLTDWKIDIKSETQVKEDELVKMRLKEQEELEEQKRREADTIAVTNVELELEQASKTAEEIEARKIAELEEMEEARREAAKEAAKKAAEEILADSPELEEETDEEVVEEEEVFEKPWDDLSSIQNLLTSGQGDLDFASSLPAELAFEDSPLKGGKKKKKKGQKLDSDGDLFRKGKKIKGKNDKIDFGEDE